MWGKLIELIYLTILKKEKAQEKMASYTSGMNLTVSEAFTNTEIVQDTILWKKEKRFKQS